MWEDDWIYIFGMDSSLTRNTGQRTWLKCFLSLLSTVFTIYITLSSDNIWIGTYPVILFKGSLIYISSLENGFYVWKYVIYQGLFVIKYEKNFDLLCRIGFLNVIIGLLVTSSLFPIVSLSKKLKLAFILTSGWW